MSNQESKSSKTPSKHFRVGVFDSVESAEAAVNGLTLREFTSDEITVFCSSEAQQNHFQDFEPSNETGAPVDRAVASGAIGSLLGGLTAVAGLVSTAGIPILAAGGLVGALNGGIVGGFAGAMSTRGLEKESADYYDQAVASGKILVSVEPQDTAKSRLADASQALEDAGAHPIKLLEG